MTGARYHGDRTLTFGSTPSLREERPGCPACGHDECCGSARITFEHLDAIYEESHKRRRPWEEQAEPSKGGWEGVHVDHNSMLERTSVPGGWLYRSTTWDQGRPRSESMVFVRGPLKDGVV